MSTNTNSDETLDLLAVQLSQTVRLLEAGTSTVALKDQLVKVYRVILDVMKDDGLDPLDDVQRDVVTSSHRLPMIPRPFRPVDVTMFTAANS